jgi:mannose-6-phosphate isomerase-like protein (cupin superfamily)
VARSAPCHYYDRIWIERGENMKVIYHKDRPLLEFPDEPWRQSLRLAVNRSAGSNSLSVWLAEMGDHHRTPLHWHDTEEVLVFLEVDGDGFARVGDEEHKIETQTSVVVPAGTVHAFGLRDGRVLKSISILPDADAVPGHRILQKGEESFEMPALKKK